MIEELAQIPVEVLIGSELRYENYVYEKDSVLLAISQSGETADTLAPLKEAKAKGVKTLGVVNVVGSTISRETDAGVYNHAGPEIGVASTKAFISQVEVLLLIAIFLGRQRHLSATVASEILSELLLLPEKLQKFLKDTGNLKDIAEKYSESKSFLYIGRKYNFSMAYEGALKMKEVSYIHAEGYGAGEMKHGPIALIDEHFPTVAIANDGSMYEKMISNIEEIRARSGPVIAIATEGNDDISRLANDVIYVPRVPEVLSPIVNAVPLQLLAYYMSVLKGLDVDKPRNLAKSVTVE
jgi:glucosamine--fructose-6-phosphate aminotransferase (isomerizing)